ncbi:MAG: EAL domain-containing protein [Actinobacteria bacterium]|nr:EAL domain-containing protein [Actinomycetota bacterium]
MTDASDHGAPADAGAGFLTGPPPELPADQAALHLELLGSRFRALVDHVPAIVYVQPIASGPMIDVSPGIESLFGVPREEWLRDPSVWQRLIHPEDRTRVLEANRIADETGGPFREEYRAVASDGRALHIRDQSTLVRDAGGMPLYWLGFMIEVTDTVATQRELADATARYGALVEQIPAIVYVDIVDEDMSTSYVSPQIDALLGYTQQEYVADPDLWKKMLHPDDVDMALDAYLRGREAGGPFTLEYRLVARDGRVVWFRDSAVVIHDGDGRPKFVHGVMLDITDRKAAEEQVAFLAYHDKLTGLPNRTMFEELLELSIARARRHELGVAVLYMDLDDFKLVNDSLGYDAGDELLRQLAERLGEATRETDLVARPGGDEFLMLLADLDRSPAMPGGTDGGSIVAQSVALRVGQTLASPFILGGHEVYVTASIGVSLFPQDAIDTASLMKNADSAMFRSKKAGPGGFVVHADDDADALSRLSLSTRLRKAVENKAWTLHYQPVVTLEDGRMVGLEALIRWQEPNGGLVPPGEFIPMAEEMGLIEAIGDWVVEEICRQDELWRIDGLSTEISFNLSPRQLWQPELVSKIIARLAHAGMDPSRVVVEITESAAMTDPDRTQQILLDLHDRGVRLALDDFGTGYSSLARLKHMPVDVLKIDRSFIREVDADRDAQGMVSAMIALASNLGMTALAEGIETEAERRFLALRGCELGQGYLFSRPVPAGEILALHRRASLRVVDGEAG